MNLVVRKMKRKRKMNHPKKIKKVKKSDLKSQQKKKNPKEK